jgi:transposase
VIVEDESPERAVHDNNYHHRARDLAKKVFQVHGIDVEGKVVVARRLRRKEVLAFFAKLPPCLVGMEACGSAHYWAREITKLGHTVKLMPPKYVKAYVKRGKTDASDAAAICEAVTRPSMSFVPVKGVEQQGLSMLHSARSLLIGQRTQLINAARGAQKRPDKHPWVARLLGRMSAKQAAIAIANKTARIAWAIMVHGGNYEAGHRAIQYRAEVRVAAE